MFFRKPVRKPHKLLRRLIVGLIIGGAIASIVGKKLALHEEDERGETKK